MTLRDCRLLGKIQTHSSTIIDYCRSCVGLEDFTQNKIIYEACKYHIWEMAELASELSSDTQNWETEVHWEFIQQFPHNISDCTQEITQKIIWWLSYI